MFKIEEVGESAISLGGQIRHQEANEIKSKLESRIKRSTNKDLDIDLSQISNVSSVVLSVLLCGIRAAKSASCNVRYINTPQGLYNMARVGGIESIIVKAV